MEDLIYCNNLNKSNKPKWYLKVFWETYLKIYIIVFLLFIIVILIHNYETK